MRTFSRALALALAATLVFPFPVSRAEDPDLLNDCDPYPYQLDQSSPNDAANPGADSRKDALVGVKPSAPQFLKPKVTSKGYGCRRLYLYRGKLGSVDSYNRQDGEQLRPILSSDPKAIEELDLYQSNRRKVRISAYLGTAELLIALGSVIAANQFTGETRKQIRTFGIIGGLGIGIGAGIFSLAILRTNESHLKTAVESFNSKNAEDKVVLQFSTGLLF